MPPEFLSRGMLGLQTAPGNSSILHWTTNPVRLERVSPGEVEVIVQVWTGTSADDEEPREDILRGRCIVEPGGPARCELHVVP